MRIISLWLGRIYLHHEDKKLGACKAYVWPWTELYQTSPTLWMFYTVARRKQPFAVEQAQGGIVRAVNLKTLGWEIVQTVLFNNDFLSFVNLNCCEVEKTVDITMSAPLLLQMCMVLTLETFLTGVGGVRVGNAKVIRGNIRRDGKIITFILADACCFSCWRLIRWQFRCVSVLWWFTGKL